MFSQAEVFIFVSMAENTFVRARAESFCGENEHFDGQCLLTTKVLNTLATVSNGLLRFLP